MARPGPICLEWGPFLRSIFMLSWTPPTTLGLAELSSENGVTFWEAFLGKTGLKPTAGPTILGGPDFLRFTVFLRLRRASAVGRVLAVSALFWLDPRFHRRNHEGLRAISQNNPVILGPFWTLFSDPQNHPADRNLCNAHSR